MVVSDTPMEEGSGVFFLSLLTSLSLCPHSLRYPWHSLLWRKVLECSSSHSPCYPCALTHRHPSVLSHTTCATTHLTLSVLIRTHTHPSHCIVIPVCTHTHDFSYHSSHTLALTQVISLIPASTRTHDLSSHTLTHPSHLIVIPVFTHP